MEDGYSITYSQKLRKVGADKKNGFSLGCQLAHPLINLGFADNINSTCGFIEKKYICLLVKKPG